MLSPEPPERRSRRAVWVLLVGALLVAGVASWYLSGAGTPAPRPAGEVASATPAPVGRDTPTTANVPKAPTERREREASRSRRTPDATATAPRPSPSPESPGMRARELRVTADVAGAYVFLDRKFLGSTPLTTRDVTPGSHQLNVQVEGRPPQVRTIDVLPEGPTIVEVVLAPAAAAAAFSASVAVVHQHGMGSCEGTLRATGDTLRYDTPHKDAFSVPLAALEQFSVAYAEKRLRVKQRGGRTWNFTTTADTADPLFVFHRDVEAARGR